MRLGWVWAGPQESTFVLRTLHSALGSSSEVVLAMDEETRWQENEVEEDQGFEKTALVNRQSGVGGKQVRRCIDKRRRSWQLSHK